MLLAVAGDLALAHRLEHGRLGARGGAVQLVGEQDMREQRTGGEDEFLRLLVPDQPAGDVAGQEVGRELDALHVERERARQGARQHGLAQPGQVLEQQVPAGDKHRQRITRHLLLALDNPADIGDHRCRDCHRILHDDVMR